MTPTERRTACLLCGGRCDPTRYLCLRCDDRLIDEMLVDLAEDAYYQQDTQQPAESTPPPPTQEAG